MGKMIVHEFNPNIYTRPLLVCLNATIDGLNEMFDFIPNNEGLEKAISGNAASVSSVVRKSDGKYAALVFSKNKRGIYGSTIAHEAVHVADYYFESLGMLSQTFTGGNEPYAYLVGWAARCINEARIYKKTANRPR